MLLNTPTHEVTNQAVPFEDVDYFEADVPLREALEREGAGWAVDRVRDAGIVAGSAEAQAHGRRAERNEPRLLTHDRYGHRLDAVELDPSWHWLLRGAVEREIHALPWRDPRPGAHVARAALELLWTQANAGVMCPVSMTYSAVPALRLDPEMAREWEPRLTVPDYERGALCGMAMTEKQGGSDVRANTTRAQPAGGGWWELTGHKWFCSYPPCELFLMLAQAPAGLSCSWWSGERAWSSSASRTSSERARCRRVKSSSAGRRRACSARRAAASRRSSRWSPTPAWTA
jgi:putative acyl-CoA dehydrogenase